jgi:ferrous iron transport protein B
MNSTSSAGDKTGKREDNNTMDSIAIVGSPNVGKSVLFNALSDRYVAVSNYPGTTVEVPRGKMKLDGRELEIIDTPGMYSLLPITEEERVARRLIMTEKPSAVIHVIDAKNLERMLPMTFQLIETGLPVILTLNIADEARKEGIHIDTVKLQSKLGIQVVETVATTGEGIPELRKAVTQASERRTGRKEAKAMEYAPEIAGAIDKLSSRIAVPTENAGISSHSMALLLLQGDEEIRELMKKVSPDDYNDLNETAEKLQRQSGDPLDYRIAVSLKEKSHEVAAQVTTETDAKVGTREKLSKLTMHPVTGFPILFLILYFGLYKFVGVFGAGTVVDFLEGTVFEGYINPVLISFFEGIIPWGALSDLFVGEYGVLTLGVRYAVALILPIVTFFFLVFAVIEDTGYLPRLAMLIDRTFKKMGLSGRAVIPMVLGLGCDTMATMVTRTLPTKRERVISTLLLALAVPCSAQLGVILALLEGKPAAALIWAGVVALVFLLIGHLASKVLPGTGASFYMEIPPLRLPKLSNVLVKTYVRVKWYFKEVLPLFIAASALIWLGEITRLFGLLVFLLRKPVELVGLPDEAAEVFLFGFFRRDYGAAGLYDLNKTGVLDGVQLVVACVALTLFLPCIAQFLMNVKERGWKIGAGMSAFILLFSFAVAFVLNAVLRGLGVTL